MNQQFFALIITLLIAALVGWLSRTFLPAEVAKVGQVAAVLIALFAIVRFAAFLLGVPFAIGG